MVIPKLPRFTFSIYEIVHSVAMNGNQRKINKTFKRLEFRFLRQFNYHVLNKQVYIQRV